MKRQFRKEKGKTFRGKASWYGPGFDNKKTASGEKYDMYAMTAASKTLLFGTIIRITNLANGKSVKVKINDRGPYVAGRILDLSKGAFRKISSLDHGVLNIKFTILDTSKIFRYKHY